MSASGTPTIESPNDIVFKSGGSNERVRITSGGNMGVGGLASPGALLSIPAGESNTPRFAIESAVDANDFTITQYEDGNGTYTMLGQNVKLNSSGNNTILDSAHRTAGILLDARNHGAITFLTGGANAVGENLKIDSDGNVLVGNTTTVATASPVNLSLGATYSNSVGQNPKLNLWEDSSGNYMSLGVSSNQMDFMMSNDNYDFVWYGQNDSNNGPEERMRIDNSEKLFDFASSSKIRLKGSQADGQAHAHLNIGSDGSANADTRAIVIWGNWQDQEGKLITWSHGSATTNMVCQQRVRYNSSPSSTYYEIGHFYHGQDTSAYPIRFVSTSTTTANLELDGNLVLADGNGIDFSATGNALGGGMSSELFDDYEEGTWTPVLAGSSTAGSLTAGTAEGRYIKIGKMVYLTWRFNNATFSGSSGTAKITGLPYNQISVNAYPSTAFGMTYNVTFDTARNQAWYIGGSAIEAIESRSAASWVSMPSSYFHTTGLYMNQFICYETT